MSESDSPPPPPPLPPRKRGRAIAPPPPVVFVNSDEPSDPSLPAPPRYRHEPRNSLYHVQRAMFSPRVWAVLAAVGGYAWAGVQYVAGTARQSDLAGALVRIHTLERQAVDVQAEASAALAGGQRCLAAQGETSLALRAIVGQIARQRGRSEQQKDNEQAAAESRYSTAITDGKPPHEAARVALR